MSTFNHLSVASTQQHGVRYDRLPANTAGSPSGSSSSAAIQVGSLKSPGTWASEGSSSTTAKSGDLR
jgi:hypothetical protein